MKKILYFGHQNEIGGGEKSLLQLIKNLNRKEYEPIVAVSSDGRFLREIKKMKLKYFNLGMKESFIHKTASEISTENIFSRIHSLFFIILYSFRLRKILKTNNIDLIHSNTLKAALIVSIGKIGINVKHVYHDRTFTYNIANKIIYKFSDKIIVISDFVKKKYKNKRGKLNRVYNGAEIKNHLHTVGHNFLREELLLDNNTIIVGLVGRITPWKGHSIFIESALKLLEKKGEYHFIIVGDDSIEKVEGFKSEIFEKVKSSGYSNNFSFLGFREDIINVMNCLDIVVVPSIEPEPFGRVVVEALGLGKFIVASNIGGIPELIDDKKTGFLFEPGNCNKLVDIINDIKFNFTHYQYVPSNAKNAFENKFRISIHARRIMELYKEIL
jgi:glycosyltransferase involved in cell wall biosynthesis